MKKFDISYRWFWIFISSVFIFLIANVVFAGIYRYVRNFEVRLSNNYAVSRLGPSNGWTVTTDSRNRVHVVWADSRRGHFEIYYKRSLNGGVTWEYEKRLIDHNLDHAIGASIASSPDGYLHVVWEDKRTGRWKLYYRRSLNGGYFFEDERQPDANNIGFGGPAVCYGGQDIVNIIYTRWVTDSYQLFNVYSKDNGVQFSLPQKLTTASSLKENPSCTIDNNGEVYIVWQDARDDVVGDRREIYFKHSPDGGETWDSDVRLTNDPGNGSSDASIAVDSNGNVHVVWHDDRSGSWEIYYKQSQDRGVTWGPDIQLTTRPDPDYNPGTIESDLPSIAVDSYGRVHIVWQDTRINNVPRVFYKRKEGNDWIPDVPVCRSMSVYPSIAVDVMNNLHFVWTDGRYAPNYEIFYNKGFYVE